MAKIGTTCGQLVSIPDSAAQIIREATNNSVRLGSNAVGATCDNGSMIFESESTSGTPRGEIGDRFVTSTYVNIDANGRTNSVRRQTPQTTFSSGTEVTYSENREPYFTETVTIGADPQQQLRALLQPK